jgi:malonyl-CoA O-methyltransferase
MATREPLPIDKRAARRFVERAARRSSVIDDPLAREVERRMAERLQYFRLTPKRILEAGCGSAPANEMLRRQFADAESILLDYSFSALARTRTPRPGTSLFDRARRLLRGDAAQRVVGELAHIPLAAGSCGLVWSNLALGATYDPLPVFREWHRILDAGGLVMFSTYGPDTLIELREAFAASGTRAEHAHRFIDMHDLGDMLVAAGFTEPVMDMEHIALNYADIAGLFRDLRATGQANALLERRRGLLARARWEAMTHAYQRDRRATRIQATFEIVYGHAWRGTPRISDDGRAIIKFDRPAHGSNR